MPRNPRIYRTVNRHMGQALHRYAMIADGDHVLVGISGGKDSLSLLWMLSDRRLRVPITYTLTAAYVDPGFTPGFADELKAFCGRLGVELTVELTDFGLAAHGPDNRENPCFLCSRRRRRRLFEVAEALGCNKVALGHHKDDLIETVFMNMAYAGEIGTMMPAQPFFGGRFTVIRPLAFTDEALIRRFAREYDFPELVNPCPSAGASKRQDIKNLLGALYATNRKIKGNIFRSLSRVRTDYLLR